MVIIYKVQLILHKYHQVTIECIGVFRFDGTNSTQDSIWSYETNQSPKEIMQSVVVTHQTQGELDLDGLSSNRISTTIGNLELWDDKSLTRNQYHIVACWFNKSGNQIGVRVDGQLHQLMIMITHYKPTKN